MKREIKFRAWNTRTKVMQYTNKEQTVWAGGLQPSINVTIATSIGAQISGDFVAMQFTGLKDKNGKEIYEGDIVELFWSFVGTSYFCKVFWFQDRACWAMVQKGKDDYDGVFHYFGSQDTKLMDVEVLGNMYEPHLLKA